MIPLRILTLIVTGPTQPSVLVLEPVEDSPEGKSRIIPIWIGTQEATQLGIAIERIRLPRPTTHDLFLDALTNLDARVDHVLISEAKGATFFAKLYLRQAGRLVELDARPTDALALAIRQEAPFYVEEDVLERASFPYVFRKRPDDEEVMQEFRSFLDTLAPEDFAAGGEDALSS